MAISRNAELNRLYVEHAHIENMQSMQSIALNDFAANGFTNDFANGFATGDEFCISCRILISAKQQVMAKAELNRLMKRTKERTKERTKAYCITQGYFAGYLLCPQCTQFNLTAIWEACKLEAELEIAEAQQLGLMQTHAYIIEQNRRRALTHATRRLTQLIMFVTAQIGDPTFDANSLFLLLANGHKSADINVTTYAYPAHSLLGVYYRLKRACDQDQQRFNRRQTQQFSKHSTETVDNLKASQTRRLEKHARLLTAQAALEKQSKEAELKDGQSDE